MLLRDALLAYAHFLAILFLTAVLCAELAVYRQELAAPVARRLQRIDLFFGIAAVVVILTGVARILFGLKGADFYLHNPVFWTKMGLFILVGLLSIAPTVHYLRWNASLSAGADSVRDEPLTFRRIRSLLIAEIVVLAFIPLCAALMSRGL
jgi:putative membrane protein